MRKSLISAALAAFVVTTAGAAFAASTTDTSTIKALDPAKHKITLTDGRTFQVPATWKFSDYKVGEKVKVTYQTQNGKMMASDVQRAS